MKYDVIVVGAGLAGLTAAAKLGEEGKEVVLISHGHGCTSLTSGSLDILGYFPWDNGVCLTKLEINLQRLINKKNNHPYSVNGMAVIKESLDFFKKLSKDMGYEYQGEGVHNYLLPTSFGTVKPTALIPPSLAEGDVRLNGNTLVVGLAEVLDFSPGLIADGVNRARRKLKVAGSWQSGGFIELEINNKNATPLLIARCLENENAFNSFIRKIKRLLANNGVLSYRRVGLPAVLGSDYNTEIFDKVSSELDCPVFEIPTGQPTVPGYRLNKLLLGGVKKRGVKVQLGSPVVDIKVKKEQVQVTVGSVARHTIYSSSELILATGGVMGTLSLPIGELRGKHNVTAVGRNLPEYDPVVEKSGLGVALVTGFGAGKMLAEKLLKGGGYSEASC